MKTGITSLVLLFAFLLSSFSLCSGDLADDAIRLRSLASRLVEKAQLSPPHARGAVPAPVPEQFASFDYTYTTEIGTNAATNMTGELFSDGVYKREVSFLSTEALPPPVSQPFVFNTWNDALRNASYIETNGVCRVSPVTEGYFGFSWLAYSHLINASSVAGNVPCELWAFTVFSNSTWVSLYLCLIPQGSWSQPVQLSIIIITPTLTETVTSTYGGFQLLKFEADSIFFEVPKKCFSDGVVCPAGPVEALTLFNFHDGEYLDIGNQNLATSVGEAYYVCSQLLGRRAPAGTNTYVSLWEIDVNTTWGMYEQCNPFGPDGTWICTGGNPSLVGRESPDAIYGAEGGQCLSDAELENVGIWYSFNNASRCDPRSGKPGCQWSPSNLLRTVDQNCLLEHGMLQSCQEDNWFPFSRSAALLQFLLTSDPNPCQ